MNEEYYMEIALKEAQKAYDEDEIPVGAVIVKNGKIISRGYNKKNRSNRVKDHAEIIAIDKANKRLKNWRLDECEIYITLEPCPMCASAIEQARIKRIITGTENKKDENKAIITQILKNKERKNGVKEKEAKEILENFFKEKR